MVNKSDITEQKLLLFQTVEAEEKEKKDAQSPKNQDIFLPWGHRINP